MANLSNINGKFVVEQTTGYVGVGTTDPNYPIEVLSASAEIALNASGGSIYRLKSDSTDYFRINKNGVGDRLVIDGSGKVGIGEDIPLSSLHVSGPAGNRFTEGLRVERSTVPAQFAMFNYNGGSLNIIATNTAGTGTSMKFQKSNDGSALIDQMVIDSSGNVGIGTDSPSVGLQLGNSTLGETKTAIFNSEGGGEVGLTVKSRTNRAKLRVADNDSNAYVVAEAGKAFFGTSANGDVNNITVLTSGKVGIGTVSPETDLMIYDTVNEDPAEPGFATTGMFALNRSGQATLSMGVGANNSFWMSNVNRAFTGPNYYNISLNPLGGRVGIGTSSPIGNFNINGGTGDVQANDVIQTFNKTTSTGNVTAAKIKLDHYNTNHSDLQFLVKTTASSAENDAYYTNALTILGRNANVGIGTNNPGKKLEVAGSYKLGTNAWIQYDAAYPYTISMLNSAGVGNLQLNAGYGSSGFESKIELQGGNTAGGASITFTTASSQALVIKNGGDLTVSGSIIDANGVRTYRNSGFMYNNVAYTFDITVPNDTSSGVVHHVDAMMTHYDTAYGCVLNCYAYTRGTAVSTQTNLVNQTSSNGGGWFVTKPNSTTLRITKSAGTYVGGGYYQIVVITKST